MLRLVRPGVFATARWRRKPTTLSHANGKNRSRSTRRVLHPSCAIPSRRNLPRYFKRKSASASRSPAASIPESSWRGATRAPGSLPCYTFGSMYRENQDVHLARRVAEMCGQPHQVITAGQEFLARFPHYAERTLYLTDGCVDTSRSADLYVNELARQIAPVRMVGTFGSEIICGLLMFKPVLPAPDIFRPEMPRPCVTRGRNVSKTICGQFDERRCFPSDRRRSLGGQMLEQTQLTIRSPYLDNEFVRTVFRAPRVEQGGGDVRLRLIREGSPAAGSATH